MSKNPIIKVLFALILLLSSIAFGTEVIRVGKSCSICMEKNGIKVCKYYDRCPIPEKKGEEGE